MKAAIVPSWLQIRAKGLRGNSRQNSQHVNVSDGSDVHPKSFSRLRGLFYYFFFPFLFPLFKNILLTPCFPTALPTLLNY